MGKWRRIKSEATLGIAQLHLEVLKFSGAGSRASLTSSGCIYTKCVTKNVYVTQHLTWI